jgi:hypothetical protein
MERVNKRKAFDAVRTRGAECPDWLGLMLVKVAHVDKTPRAVNMQQQVLHSCLSYVVPRALLLPSPATARHDALDDRKLLLRK